jgi:prepilin-type N-terminal cleavage/methylation domain-containing protein/prepilin-type processing-associated H-X9-DG protein
MSGCQPDLASGLPACSQRATHRTPRLDFRFHSTVETNKVVLQLDNQMTKNVSRGFTLIELLVVIAVIAILGTIAYPVYTGVQERAKVTKDMSNLRQIGLATQTYMNDNDGVLFSTTAGGGIWMAQLHPKYASSWNVFHSPFDTRAPSELPANAPISYGLNGVSPSIIGMAADKISKPSIFILFAPAQAPGPAVGFTGGTNAPVTVYRNITPAASGGTHNNRKRINALFADLHSESMDWTTFITVSDPDGYFRWNPF